MFMVLFMKHVTFKTKTEEENKKKKKYKYVFLWPILRAWIALKNGCFTPKPGVKSGIYNIS